MVSKPLFVVVICLTFLFVASNGVQPNEDEYTVYKLIQKAIVDGSTDGVSNLYVLETNFYPAQRSSPICIPVDYDLMCNYSHTPCFKDDADTLNTSFLWSEYDLTQPIGAILLSYAYSGIILKGFDWEHACIYTDPFRLSLTLTADNMTLFDDTTITNALLKITSQVSFYSFSHVSVM